MNVISLRDYAKQNNVTYEAVRQQVKRYARELGEHIIRDGRQQFLDEEAVAFLDGKRQKNPVVVMQQDKDEQIEALERENKNLLITVAELSAWKADNAVAIAEASHREFLLEEGRRENAALTAQNAVLSAENEAARGKIAEADNQALKANSEAYRANQYSAALEAYIRARDEYDRLPFYKRWGADKPIMPTRKDFEEPPVPNNGQSEDEE